MGAMAGVVAVLLGSLLSYFMMMSGLAPTFEDVLQQMADSGQMPDEQFEVIEGIFNSPLIYVAFLGVGSVIGAIMGAIGGAVGASIFKKGGEFPS
jgi:amino acid transporter